MHYYNPRIGEDLVSVDEILLRYLWNQIRIPTPSELNDERFIRDNDELGALLTIDTEAYMQSGPGRFVSAADVPLFQDFFNTELPQGIYTHAEIWEKLRPNLKDKIQKIYTKDVSQYYTGIGSPDYITRAFIFGSTKFAIDLSQVTYIVHQGGKVIQNVKFLPAQLLVDEPRIKENFDFEGGGELINWLNRHFESVIDPSGIGRLIPIEFSNQNNVQAVNIDKDKFKQLMNRKELLADDDLINQADLGAYLLRIEEAIFFSPSTLNKDNEGRRVIYDGKNKNEINVKDFLDKLNSLDRISDKARAWINSFFNSTGYSLIGGNGDNKLIGSDLNDLLKGGKNNDILDGGEGEDTLDGGDGFDIYHAGKGDTIIDSDGMGRVYLNGKLLTGGERNSKDSSIYKGSDGTIYIWGGDDLTVGGLTIKNFDGNGLGIKLADKNDKKPDVGAAERLGSPLVIDMNGDGARSVEQNRHYVYFDLDNNGFAERTGWADKDDALLVLDRNGNGTIDNGSELFGNYTALKTGGYAENGFEALKDFDENKDNVLTRDDPIWSQLQLWRDVNINGITEAGELTSVNESALASVNLAYQNIAYFDRGQNIYKQKSDVTWQDNSQTEIVDFWFGNDVGDTQAVAVDVNMTEEVADLPNISASGNVYNLHTAMLLNPKLKEKVQSYIAATPERRNELLDELIYVWTGADKHSATPRGYIEDGRQLAALEALIGRSYYQNEVWKSDPGPNAAKVLNSEYEKLRGYVSAQIAAQTDYKDIFDSVRLRYEHSTQKVIYDWDKLHIHIMLLRNQGKTDESDTLIDIAQKLGTYSTELKVNYLSRPTRSENDVNIFEGGNRTHDAMISTPNNDEFYAGWGNDAFILGENWGQDTIKLYPKDSEDVDTLYFTDINLMPESLVLRREKGDQLVIRQKGTENTVTVEYQFSEHPTLDRIIFADGIVWNRDMIDQLTVKGTEDDDTIIGATDKDVIYAGEGNDVVKGRGRIYGENGNDRLSIVAVNAERNKYSDGNEQELMEGSYLSGGLGDDVLAVLWGIDTLRYQYDDDWNVVSSFRDIQAAHILDGGSGNDEFYGSYGDEVYHFDSNFGHDDIHNDGGYDVIRFGEGIAASDISYYREGDNLLLKHINGKDQITVHKHFVEWAPEHKISVVQFADGTSFTNAQFESQVAYYGTDEAENIFGQESAESIYGLGGNDYIDGRGGDDRLFGGAGNDRVKGGVGDDILDGGVGDDHYYYASGSGADIIDQTGGGKDILFTLDVNAERLSFRKDGEDLLVLIDKDDKQSIRIKQHFLGGEKALFGVQPKGGYTITASEIVSRIKAQELGGNYTSVIDGTENKDSLVGSAGSDLLRGWANNDNLFGFAGNDRLEGGDNNDYLAGGNGMGVNSGNDLLIGGAGNDTLYGEDGNDLLLGGAGRDYYLYNEKQGIDLIKTGGGGDVLTFRQIASSRLSYHRVDNDLVVLVDKDTKQQVRVVDHFSDGDNALGGIQSQNGYLNTANINKQLTAMPDMEAEIARQLHDLINAMATFDTQGGTASVMSNSVNELQDLNRYLTGNLA